MDRSKSTSSPIRRRAPSSPSKLPLIKKSKLLSPQTTVRANGKVSLPKVSSVTFQELDSGEELEVLKCILVREGYLQRLTRASCAGHIAGAHLSETVDVLDLLRLATLETVEAVVTWRAHKSNKSELEQFKWNGINYLLKLASDLEFLEKHTGLVAWLGFTLQRNPFVLPLNLDCRAKLISPSVERVATAESDRFLQVGGKRSHSTDATGDPNKSEAEALALALADRRRAKTPYETRVLNDEELVPYASSFGVDRPKSRAPRGKTKYSSVLPSQIGQEDMARIYEAECVVLQEEAAFGRFARDIHGRLVPEDEAQRRFRMVELSGNAYNVPTSLQSSYTEDSEGGLRLPEPPQSEIPGKAHAKKRSGMLGPISKPDWRAFDRPPAPRRRARGAQLEEALAAERKANAQLGVLLDSMKEEMERKAMDIAFFESCCELRGYSDELKAFTVQAQGELDALRKEFQLKKNLYERKTVNVQKKEELLNTFKTQHKTIMDKSHVERIERSRFPSFNQQQQRREDQEQAAIRAAAATERHQHEQSTPLVQHFCATQIQKLARGMIARQVYEQMKIEFVVASTFIQAGVRGFLVRRRVARMYWHRAASIHLQRVARGFLARQFTKKKRLERKKEQAARQIQRVVRGRFGRVRMIQIRELVGWRLQLALAGRSINAVALKELADACLAMVSIPNLMKTEGKTEEKPLSALVLGLVRLLMLFTSDSDGEWDIPTVRWREACRFLRCGVGVTRRMQRISDAVAGAARALMASSGAAGVAASTPYLRESVVGLALLKAYKGDLDFTVETFERIPIGWQAAVALFKWTSAFCAIMTLQYLLEPSKEGVLVVSRTLSKREIQQEQTERREADHNEEVQARRFVPVELVQARGYPFHRPRPLLLVVANDVPQKARTVVIEKLQVALPGLFVTITRPPASTRRSLGAQDTSQPFDFEAIRGALALGHSVILEGDVGLRDATQRAFLSCFAAIKHGLNPLPTCVLLRGTITNRSDLFGQKQGSDVEEEAYRQEMARRMVDADLKVALDRTTRLRLELGSESVACAMVEQGSTPAPAPALVVVMEAVIVLLTPGKDYEGPSQSDFATSSVSWRLSRRLLTEPAHLRFKLQQVDVARIPAVNLRALERYMRHSLWPNAEISRSQTSSTRLLYALASWVEAAIGAAQLIAAEGTGLLASEITRFGPVPGLFERVVVFNNCPTGIEQEGAGEDSAVVQLMDAALSDVRVYRTAHLLVRSRVNPSGKSQKKKNKMAADGEERCVVTLFHDCRRIFASVYKPSSGQSWMTVISEDDIDHLLTPTGRQDKLPPKSHAEMYARLARLCLLQRRKVSNHPESVEAPNPYELVLRPPSIRLYRHVLQLGGFLTTVTIAELSRGHIQVDVFVHSSSQSSGQCVTLTLAVELENVLGRLSAAQARREFIPAPRLPFIMLDRLHLYCATRTQVRALELERPKTSLRLGVRTGESSPGRVLLRRAVRIPRGFETAERWVFTLVERHDDGEFQAAFYSPSSSLYQSIRLSSSAAQELLHLSRHSTPSKLEQVLVRTFTREKLAPKQVDVEDSDTDDEEPQEADTTACYRLRRRIITRFPCSFRVLQDQHQLVTKKIVVRAYVQVELCEQSEEAIHPSIDSICYRVWLPGSCLEQSLILQPSEVEASLPESLPWQYSSLKERGTSSRDLVRRYFHWDPNGGTGENGCVVAHLPVGSFWATERTSVSDRQPVKVDQLQHQSRTNADTEVSVVSCTRLLDDRDTESDDEDEVEDHKKIYSYDTEELVHRGSYRANGLYVVVRVTMRAQVLRDLQPALASPTDRVRERDSFVINFHVYHPASSTSATVAIRGHRDLREVVGPDQPSLISSTSLDSLMRHIVLRRLWAQVDRMKGLEVTFLRDRLYAKQKATPVTKTFERDSTVNAAKLIDEARRKGKAGERGTKVLTTAKILPGCGRTLLTVFDMATNRQQVLLRVDAYVCASSARLSLLLEGSDLVHVVGDEDKELLLPVTCSDPDTAETVEMQNQQSRKLVLLVLEHLRVDQRSDGRGARLVLSDYSTFQTDSANTEAKNTRLFKTVRAVGYDQIVLSGYLEQGESTKSLSLRLELYEPTGSSRCRMTISQLVLSAMLGLPQLPNLDQIVKAADRGHLTTHICSLLHIEKLSAISDGAVDNPPTFAMTLNFDEKRSVGCVKQHMFCDSGDIQAACQCVWTGLTTSTEDTLLSVHLQLLHSVSANTTRRWLMCSTYAPADFLVNARTFEWTEIPADLLTLVDQQVSDYTPFFSKVCERLRLQVEHEAGGDEETSERQARSIRISLG